MESIPLLMHKFYISLQVSIDLTIQAVELFKR
jgi:hypothetical protein